MEAKPTRFSLILCTLNRMDTLAEFMECLCYQDFTDFELILVDQNKDDRLVPLINRYGGMYRIKHIRSEKGLSKSRNVGLKYANGEIIAFPDDDCIYPPSLLKEIDLRFKQGIYDVLSIKMTNSVPHGRKIQDKIPSQWVKRETVMLLMASISMFYRSHVVDAVGGFDERLGLGANTIFRGGEDYDYPLRAMGKGFSVYFDNSLEVYHPWDDADIDREKDLGSKVYNGGAAEMFVLNKHRFGTWYKVKRVIRRLLIIAFYMCKLDLPKAGLSLRLLRGMLDYFNYRPPEKGCHV